MKRSSTMGQFAKFRKLPFSASLLLAALCLFAIPAWAEDITARVIKVPHDGDTFMVKLDGCDCLPKLFQTQAVRLLGCDTPEIHDTRPDMASKAQEAKAFTADRIKAGQIVTLHDVRRDKYGGRMLAKVEVDGRDLCAELIAAGLAREYWGKGPKPW